MADSAAGPVPVLPGHDPETIAHKLAARSERHRLDRGGPLLVSGGGAAYVATDALRAYAERLTVLGDALEHARSRTRTLVAEQRAIGTGPGIPAPVAAALAPVERLDRVLRDLVDRVRSLHGHVVDAATAYTASEGAVVAVLRGMRGSAASLLGTALRLAAPFALPGVLLTAGTAVAVWNALPGTDVEKGERVHAFVQRHPELLTSPEFVELVRGFSTDLDNVALGALLPPPLAALIGDDTFGLTGVETSGAVLMTLASPFGLLRDSRIDVRKVTERPLGSPAQGVAARLDRVPDGDQVRIERYTAPGAPPRYVVYVAPTGTFSPKPSAEPWDLQSNIAGVSGMPAASYRATEEAMRDAGISASDEVQFVGFSQGGLVAGMLAASGDWTTAGLETTGAPTATLGIPGSTPGLDIRNREDFIPALAGTQPVTDRVQVERQAFATGSPPTDLVVPAHQRATYLETAKAVDRAESDAVRGQIAAMDAFTAEYAAKPGAEMTVLTYHADRTWG